MEVPLIALPEDAETMLSPLAGSRPPRPRGAAMGPPSVRGAMDVMDAGADGLATGRRDRKRKVLWGRGARGARMCVCMHLCVYVCVGVHVVV